MAKTEFDNYIADEVSKLKGVYMPVKAGLLERLFKKRLHMNKLHPNPDDESVICSYGREYGFEAFQLDADDDNWKEKVIERAEEVKRKRGV